MTKTKLTATFSNGRTITRGTKRTYSHAWQVVRPGGGGATGFARTYALARAAADSYANTWVADAERICAMKGATGGRGRRMVTPEWIKWAKGVIAENGGKDAYLAKVRAERAATTVEIVATVEM